MDNTERSTRLDVGTLKRLLQASPQHASVLPLDVCDVLLADADFGSALRLRFYVDHDLSKDSS
jgi:hypothetical protein